MSEPHPRWVPAFTAFDALREQYEKSNFYADEEVCWRAANDTLLRRLEAGQLPARAARASLSWDDGTSIEHAEVPPSDADGKVGLPANFWGYYKAAPAGRREGDWLSGDFSFVFRDNVSNEPFIPTGRGFVIDLELDASHLPQIASKGEKAQPAGTRAGGRPAASWWPDFAEELAVYIHDTGSPDGEGHEGQSTVIDAVFARMAEQGKPEPGRGTVQPVVNAVLRRIRSAEN